MNDEKQHEQGTKNVLYSVCSGFNFYQQVAGQKCSVFGKSKNIVQHVKTGDLFYLSELPQFMTKRFKMNFWTSLIRRPVDLEHFIWPVDIVSMPDVNSSPYAMVFPVRARPAYNKLTDALSDVENLGWQQEWVRKLIADFLDAWCNFEMSPYAYHEFSEQNMFWYKEKISSKCHVLFDFSFSTHGVRDMYTLGPVESNRITPEYADSLYYENGQLSMDRASDYYSIAVILFKLLIGRLPYQGAVVEHEQNATETEHANWIRIYHENPYFIFDEQDDINRIGGISGFSSDRVYVKRWEELPRSVRNMFHNVFQTANVRRTANELFFYSPTEWRNALFNNATDVPLVYRTYM